MRNQFRLSAVSVLVLTVLASPALAIDGWDFSSQNARNEALQTDFATAKDSYNIWVNPAQVNNYSDRLDINLTENEDGVGVFKTLGNNHVLGAYIGRPTASTPENQFDLFWGINEGINLGMRLNYQAIEENDSGPTSTDTSNDLLPTDTSYFSSAISRDDSFEANEINISFGFELPGIIEGALLIGKPDSSSRDKRRDTGYNNVLNGTDRTVISHETWDDTTSSNYKRDGDNLGLALRGEHADILTTFMYSREESDGRNTWKSSGRDIFDADVTDGVLGANVLDTDTSRVYTDTYKWTEETTTIRLQGAKDFNPTPSTVIAGSLGFISSKREGVGSLVVTRDTLTDNLTLISPTTYGGVLGTISSYTEESDSIALPFIVAIEGQVNPDWTARASVKKNLYQKTETTGTNRSYYTPTPPAGFPATPPTPQQVDEVTHTGSESVWSGTDTTVALGFGYTKNSVVIDTVVLKDFVMQGTDEAMAARINITYLF